MSATILGVKAWSTATPQQLSDAFKSAKSSPESWGYDGQKFFDTINAIENAWKAPSGPDDQDTVCIWGYPYPPAESEWDTYPVIQAGKTVEIGIIWQDGNPYSVCILDTDD